MYWQRISHIYISHFLSKHTEGLTKHNNWETTWRVSLNYISTWFSYRFYKIDNPKISLILAFPNVTSAFVYWRCEEFRSDWDSFGFIKYIYIWKWNTLNSFHFNLVFLVLPLHWILYIRLERGDVVFDQMKCRLLKYLNQSLFSEKEYRDKQ